MSSAATLSVLAATSSESQLLRGEVKPGVAARCRRMIATRVKWWLGARMTRLPPRILPVGRAKGHAQLFSIGCNILGLSSGILHAACTISASISLEERGGKVLYRSLNWYDPSFTSSVARPDLAVTEARLVFRPFCIFRVTPAGNLALKFVILGTGFARLSFH